jgi:hypothetical protein
MDRLQAIADMRVYTSRWKNNQWNKGKDKEKPKKREKKGEENRTSQTGVEKSGEKVCDQR